jgi:phospholipase C
MTVRSNLAISARFILCALLLAACSPGFHSASDGASSLTPNGRVAVRMPSTSSSGGKIQHVVIIIQENRSFDNLFQGFPNANTASSGQNSKGETIKLKPVSLGTQYVIDHSVAAFLAACNGTGSYPGTDCQMNGFDKEESFGGPSNPEYVYVPHDESKPYFDMAHEWVLADNNFQSHLDESFVGHQYLIAAQASGSVDLPYDVPWGCAVKDNQVPTLTQKRTIGPNIAPCYDNNTIGQELDAAGLTWHFYSSVIDSGDGVWSAYQTINKVYNGPDWAKDVITPQTRFFTDLQAGLLSNVTWITPICENSDHVNCGGGYGPSWVTALVDAIGGSPFWDSTAIFVVWDDWGGLYDHVPPQMLDYDGLGFRVPILMISPYAKHNHVSHVQYESASILKFTEDQFGLPRLTNGGADDRSTSPAADCFDFTQAPRPFVPIKAPGAAVRTTQDLIHFFMMQPHDGRSPDDE